eukprot:5529137-Amphidinium_carterae.1
MTDRKRSRTSRRNHIHGMQQSPQHHDADCNVDAKPSTQGSDSKSHFPNYPGTCRPTMPACPQQNICCHSLTAVQLSLRHTSSQ